MVLADAVADSPWWGVAVIAGAFTVLGLLLGAINERVRERSRLRIERNIRWDERRLDLFVRATTQLHDAQDALRALATENISEADRIRHRGTVGAAYNDLKPMVRALSLLQLSGLYMDVQQAHTLLLTPFIAGERAPNKRELDDLRMRLLSAEQGMRRALGTSHIKSDEFKNPRDILKAWWRRVTNPLRKDWPDDGPRFGTL